MTSWLSRPVETLPGSEDDPITVDTLIVGSGYGAAMAALALSEGNNVQAKDIVVFERGEEYLPHDFPRTLGELPGHAPNNVNGDTTNSLWDVRAGKRAVSVSGNGLGGTSLVNASVAVSPDKATLDLWPDSGVESDWHSLFEKCYPKINELLGVSRVDNPAQFAKFNVLSRTVREIDKDAAIEAAPVAINFNGTGTHSVEHKPCNHCGNCVIGCHSGAKQSLNLNAWPLAKQHGVELYTGAQVRYLSEHGDLWRVHCRTSRDISNEFVVVAKRVILAAGSIGSTEILHRSGSAVGQSNSSGLWLSPMLGKNFSANGDGLIFTSGEGEPVNAIADVPDDTADGLCGPTIIGFARTSVNSARENPEVGRLTVEDGAIPYPMAEIWRETITMQSYIRRFVSDDRTAWHQNNADHDELATSNDFASHSQVLLTMGFDGSPGQLVADKETGNLLPVWPERKSTEGYYNHLDALFKANEPAAYSGGEYHANPLLQLLPREFNQVFEGADNLEQRIVTVHPLGGCIMGDSSATGVVNTSGQVFRGEPDQSIASVAVYENLYVLDGAILPSAVGVNPMIAISALSYTLASRIAGLSVPRSDAFGHLAPENRKLPSINLDPVNRDKSIHARFNERLLWNVESEDSTDLQHMFSNKLPVNTKTLVLDIAFFFDDEKFGDGDNESGNSLDKWLCNHAVPLRASAELKASDRQVLHGSADTFVPMPVLMTFNGQVTLGSSDDHYFRFYRTALAVCRFIYYRPYAFLSAFTSVRNTNDQLNTSAHDSVKGFLRVARMHTNWRYLEYELAEAEATSDTPLTISGRKKLDYTPRGESVWQALLNLPAVFKRGKLTLNATLSVDLLRITRGPSPLQITRSPDEPTSIAAMGGFGLLLTRLLGSTHFWSFGAHDYDSFQSEDKVDDARRRKPPEYIEFERNGEVVKSLAAEFYSEPDPVVPEASEEKELLARLVRYREDDNPDRSAVLLVHGLSHSSEIFWPEHTRETYVQYLLNQGYDVWVFDHRTSGNTRLKVNKDHTWDDIARHDVPWAVNHVFVTINSDNHSGTSRLVNVFSHCIGAGAVAMAVLDGRLQQPDDSDESMLGALVPHAVTPWVFSSCENRTRGNVWGFVKDFNLLDILDPRMHNEPTGFDTILDRIATSTIDATARKQWPFFKNIFSRRSNEYAMAMYFRYTVFWGQQWVHRNVTDALKKRFPTMVGEVPATILQQTFFSVRRKRLVTQEAENSYVTEERFKRYWKFPTLFLHGQSNQVFDVESSRLSAYRLSRFRHEKVDPKHDTVFSMADYAHHGVWLETVPDYGHMDMIIGNEATSVVGPLIDKFFKASVKHNTARSNIGQGTDAMEAYSVFESCYSNERQAGVDLPLTRTRESKFPYTGPTLSYAKPQSLRLWVEADDYDTVEPVGLSVAQSHPADLQLEALAIEKSDAAPHGVYRGVTINSPKNITDSITISLQHAEDISTTAIADPICNSIQCSVTEHKGSQDFGRQRDIDHDKGVQIDLAEMPWFRKLYGVGGSSNDISFIAGSCLHPGSVFTRDMSDSVFNGIWKHFTRPESGQNSPDFLLLLGDQIYADATAGLFDPKASYERYRMRYREAFGARGMRRVLSHVPTYFVVDDHAFYDNYSGLDKNAELNDFDIAKAEAMHFQSQLNNTSQLWSDFEVHQQVFFCFDTRFERKSDVYRTERSAIISKDQARAFENWLDNNRHRKSLFLCTGSPLFPVRREYVNSPQLLNYSDTLISYPGFLKYLVEKLSDLDCQIFLLSGDPHLSCRGTGVLSISGRSVTITNVVTSPLHAPYPFANAHPKDFDWHSEQTVRWPGSGLSLNFHQELLSTARQQFCRMDYSDNSGMLAVKAYSPDGMEIGANSVAYS